MKYIRTKDRIIDIKVPDVCKYFIKNHSLFCTNHLLLGDLGNRATTNLGSVIKQADTIEELCDEFVELGNHTPFLNAERFEEWTEERKKFLIQKGKEIKGAIWTDKGLIYVAKMNEKGELELL